jgi:Uma2 family endonuclease
MSSLARSLVSEAEFLRLPETTEKVELIDGEVNVSPSPTYWHQEVLGRLVMGLRQWAATQEGPVLVGQAPLDVRFAPGRILQPDAFVAFIALPPSHEGPIDHVPALCVEVLSQNRVYDRVTKRFIYAIAGVSELWTVEPIGLVERWSGPGLSQNEQHEDRLTSPLLPGFAFDLAQIRPN